MVVKLKPKYLLSLMALLISGCMNTDPSSEFCQHAFDIGLGDDEHLDDMNGRKIQAMDMYGEKRCGW